MDMISDAVQDGKEFFTANSTSNATTVNIQNDAADTANEIKITDELSTEKKAIPESKILEALINNFANSLKNYCQLFHKNAMQ